MSANANQSAVHLLDRTAWTLLKQRQSSSLQKGEWALLRHLDNGPAEFASVKAFAAYYGVVQSYAARLAAKLERRGVIEKFPDPGDSRRSFMALTDKGKKLLGDDPMTALAARLRNAMAPADLQRGRLLLARLLEAFVAYGVHDRTNRLDDIDPHQAPPATAQSGPDDLNETSRTVARLITHAADDIYEAASANGLTRTDWAALRHFQLANEATQNAESFIREKGFSRAIASQAITGLAEKGLLDRKRSAQRHGFLIVTITEAGRRALENEPLDQLDRRLYEDFDKDDLGALTVFLRKVLEICEGAAPGPSSPPDTDSSSR